MGGLVGAVVTVKSLVIKLGDSSIVIGSVSVITVKSLVIRLGDSDIVMG